MNTQWPLMLGAGLLGLFTLMGVGCGEEGEQSPDAALPALSSEEIQELALDAEEYSPDALALLELEMRAEDQALGQTHRSLDLTTPRHLHYYLALLHANGRTLETEPELYAMIGALLRGELTKAAPDAVAASVVQNRIRNKAKISSTSTTVSFVTHSSNVSTGVSIDSNSAYYRWPLSSPTSLTNLTTKYASGTGKAQSPDYTITPDTTYGYTMSTATTLIYSNGTYSTLRESNDVATYGLLDLVMPKDKTGDGKILGCLNRTTSNTTDCDYCTNLDDPTCKIASYDVPDDHLYPYVPVKGQYYVKAVGGKTPTKVIVSAELQKVGSTTACGDHSTQTLTASSSCAANTPCVTYTKCTTSTCGGSTSNPKYTFSLPGWTTEPANLLFGGSVWTSTCRAQDTDFRLNVYATAYDSTGAILQNSTAAFSIGGDLADPNAGKKIPFQFFTGCIEGSSRVTLADGTDVSIESLVQESSLAARGIATDTAGARMGLYDTVQGVDTSIYRIVEEGGRSLLASAEHPFFTPSGVIPAYDLRTGDLVEMVDGYAQIVSVEEVPFDGYTYNLILRDPQGNAAPLQQHSFYANEFKVGDFELQNHLEAASDEGTQVDWKRLWQTIRKSRA